METNNAEKLAKAPDTTGPLGEPPHTRIPTPADLLEESPGQDSVSGSVAILPEESPGHDRVSGQLMHLTDTMEEAAVAAANPLKKILLAGPGVRGWGCLLYTSDAADE